MPYTRQEIGDIKVIIKETISELFADENFINILVGKLEHKLETRLCIPDMKQKMDELQKEMVLLKHQNKQLQGEVDKLNQHIKRKSLIIHGIKENGDEDIRSIITKVFKDRLNTNIPSEELENCFRIGKKHNGKRPVLTTFRQQSTKWTLLKNRKALKGTGITITEDMTTENFNLLKKAKEQLGQENVWFYGGHIKGKLGNTKYTIDSEDDIHRLKRKY
nr:unnamed protein product [Callosobruchus analis]CAI5857722.1 unnamed protein product [Callosobruchus analis]CAI5869483.1 unnamed protein product [Callosobruchus analis]